MLFSPIKPMLLGTGKEVTDDPNTIWYIKWDGWRTPIHKEGDKVEVYTRVGNNITSKFLELIEVGQSIKAHTAIIDAEGVVLRSGNSIFEDFAYRGSLLNKGKIEQLSTNVLTCFRNVRKGFRAPTRRAPTTNAFRSSLALSNETIPPCVSIERN